LNQILQNMNLKGVHLLARRFFCAVAFCLSAISAAAEITLSNPSGSQICGDYVWGIYSCYGANYGPVICVDAYGTISLPLDCIPGCCGEIWIIFNGQKISGPPNSVFPVPFSHNQVNNNNDLGKSGDPGCGMPVWNVTEPYVSLWLHDEPLGYQPAVGPRISFKASFGQRETSAGYDPNMFSLGKRWNCSWLSYVAHDQSGSNVVYFPDGGNRTYFTTNDYLTNTRLTGDTTNGFTVSYPDGSKKIYGLIVTNSLGVFQKALLTELWNAQAQKTLLHYAGYNPASPVIRLQYVIDGDGGTNSLSYTTNNVYSTNLVSQVTDPFGRCCTLLYDSNGDLTNITDVAGISSSPRYDSSNRVTSLVTPYGTTAFSFTDSSGPNGRSILVTHPDSAQELFFYSDQAAGVASSYATNQIPATSPFTNTLDNADLNVRNTFHWGPRQYAALSTTNIWGFKTNDFRLTRMWHWLVAGAGTNVGMTVSMEREPSPDSGGSIEGQKTWLDYTGKTNSEYEGSQILPLFAAYILPDGTTAFTRTDRNLLGNVVTNISTYAGGMRTNLFGYDANGIDLITATDALGIPVSSNSYNAYHEVLAHFDALGELTSYAYNTNQQVTSITIPTGLVTTNIYRADNFPAQQIAIGFTTNTFTYTNDLVFTHTDARGLTTTSTWDNLNRLTSTAFPDDSSISNVYTFLDLTATKDRMGNWTYFGLDSMRRKVAETNAIGAVTLWNYCTCGALESIQDAAGNFTYFNQDNQGNTTNTLYADGYSVTKTYNLLRQAVIVADSGGYGVTNYFNNQGLPVMSSNAFGQVQSAAYDILDRATNSVDANGVDIGLAFDNLNRPLAKSYPDGGVEHWGYTLNVSGATSYTNQLGNVTLYGLDALNRKTNEVSVGVTTNSFTYNGANDRLTITDGKNQTTGFGIDLYGNVTNKVDAANNLIFAGQYDANNRLTNRWTPAKGSTALKYDAVNNLTNIVYPTSPAISLAYDLLNHLTNMTDAVGTTRFTWDSVNELLSEGERHFELHLCESAEDGDEFEPAKRFSVDAKLWL